MLANFLRPLRRTPLWAVLTCTVLYAAPGCRARQDASLAMASAATINGSVLTVADVRDAFMRQRLEADGAGGVGHTSDEVVLEQVVDQLIERRLLTLEARAQHLAVFNAELDQAWRTLTAHWSPEALARWLVRAQTSTLALKEDLREMMLAHKYLRVMVLDRVAVLDTHIEDYLRDHPELLKNPERARVRQIVVADKASADKVVAALARRTSFIDVARTLSITPEAVTGGDLGVLTRDRLPATVADVVFKLPVKKVSGQTVLHDGIHFYWVSEKFPSSPLPLTQARPRAEAILRRQAEARAAQEHIEALRRSAQVTKQEITLAHIL